VIRRTSEEKEKRKAFYTRTRQRPEPLGYEPSKPIYLPSHYSIQRDKLGACSTVTDTPRSLRTPQYASLRSIRSSVTGREPGLGQADGHAAQAAKQVLMREKEKQSRARDGGRKGSHKCAERRTAPGNQVRIEVKSENQIAPAGACRLMPIPRLPDGLRVLTRCKEGGEGGSWMVLVLGAWIVCEVDCLTKRRWWRSSLRAERPVIGCCKYKSESKQCLRDDKVRLSRVIGHSHA